MACSLFGHTRQAYYQKKRDEREWMRRVNRIIDTVSEIRRQDPGIGGYKLWLMTKRMFRHDWVPGRDQFLALLHTFGYTLKRPRPRRTTNSNHRYHKYRNLIKGFVPTEPNTLWVSDITYIDTLNGCCYLHLITDAYSRKIVGWCLSETLHAAHTVKALKMAVGTTGKGTLEGLIHHSDRGVQYCCDEYVNLLTDYHIRISMTEDCNPTDNAIAERVNGTLKTEVIYREQRFFGFEDAKRRIASFIDFYNDKRPHSSIGMKVPSQAHQESGEQRKCW